jgi:hypothetical protein
MPESSLAMQIDKKLKNAAATSALSWSCAVIRLAFLAEKATHLRR